ncbi:hypothetical protein VNO77_17515 [Canavalia gladiata]|uniref:Uncharacterized protein n=1 Tax=Canavalia gladiata TaxID=3824 RepID=A0AAN9LJB0_CANGL
MFFQSTLGVVASWIWVECIIFTFCRSGFSKPWALGGPDYCTQQCGEGIEEDGDGVEGGEGDGDKGGQFESECEEVDMFGGDEASEKDDSGAGNEVRDRDKLAWWQRLAHAQAGSAGASDASGVGSAGADSAGASASASHAAGASAGGQGGDVGSSHAASYVASDAAVQGGKAPF